MPGKGALADFSPSPIPYPDAVGHSMPAAEVKRHRTAAAGRPASGAATHRIASTDSTSPGAASFCGYSPGPSVATAYSARVRARAPSTTPRWIRSRAPGAAGVMTIRDSVRTGRPVQASPSSPPFREAQHGRRPSAAAPRFRRDRFPRAIAGCEGRSARARPGAIVLHDGRGSPGRAADGCDGRTAPAPGSPWRKAPSGRRRWGR